MTYTANQEVATWDVYQESMYDLNLPEVLSDSEQCFNDGLELKVEADNYTSYSPYQPQTSNMLASPVMNMPILCRSYNSYSPASAIQSMASPSPNAYVGSPGDSSTYSASPINSPQQYTSEELMMRYGMRHHQAFQPRPSMPPTNEY